MNKYILMGIIGAILVFLVTVGTCRVANLNLGTNQPIEVALVQPISPTPPPTPGPGIGYRAIIVLEAIPAQFEASDFPESIRTDAQTRHIVAPGCGSSASGTKLYYAYTYPDTLGALTHFSFSDAFNDVDSLTQQTGYSERSLDSDEDTVYRVYITPQLVCNIVGGHRIEVLP